MAEEALHLGVVELGEREGAHAHEVVPLAVVGAQVLVATEVARRLLVRRAGRRQAALARSTSSVVCR